MAVAEFKQFFLRNQAVNFGQYPDQENGYPYFYNVTVTNPDGSTRTVVVGNRFNSGDVPSNATFAKLFESCAFLLNSSDTAKLDRQGLVKKPNGLQIANKVHTDTGSYTIGVTPANLPVVESNITNPTNISITKKYFAVGTNVEISSPSTTDEVYEKYVLNYTNPPNYETYKLIVANNPSANINTFPVEVDVDSYNKVLESGLNYSISEGMKIKSKIFFTSVPLASDITLDRMKVKLGNQDLFVWNNTSQMGSLENVGAAKGFINIELTFFAVDTLNNTCKVSAACSLEFFDASNKSYLTIPNSTSRNSFKGFQGTILNLSSLSSSQLLKVLMLNDYDLGNTVIDYYEVTASR